MYNQYLNPRSVVFNIIFLNILFFIVTGVVGAKNTEIEQKALEYCALYYPASPLFKPVQLITYMFLHANVWHILGNMFGLFFLGNVLERVWGPRRFFIFYFVCGVGSALFDFGVMGWTVYHATGSLAPPIELVQQSIQLARIYYEPSIGASGAIFGIAVAFAMLFPNVEMMIIPIPIPIKAKYLITGYVLWEVFSAYQHNPSDNIAHVVHLGGALFGFIMVKIWNQNRDYLY